MVLIGQPSTINEDFKLIKYGYLEVEMSASVVCALILIERTRCHVKIMPRSMFCSLCPSAGCLPIIEFIVSDDD